MKSIKFIIEKSNSPVNITLQSGKQAVSDIANMATVNAKKGMLCVLLERLTNGVL